MKLSRADVVKIVGPDPKLIAGFEAVQSAAIDNADAVQASVAATDSIGQATVIVLSPNAAFDNEYVLAVVGLTLKVDDGKVTIGLPFTLNGPGRLTLNRVADTNLTLPQSGTLATTIDPGPYADDVAAAAAGVEIGERYSKTGGNTGWRVS